MCTQHGLGIEKKLSVCLSSEQIELRVLGPTYQRGRCQVLEAVSDRRCGQDRSPRGE